jgi:hypothetical protein
MSYVYLIIILAPFACVFLLNMALEPARKPPKYLPNQCTKSAPRAGILFLIASLLLLAGAVAALYDVVFKVYNVNAFFLSLPIVAAGVLFTISGKSEKRFLAATVCLLLSVAVNFFNIPLYASFDFWTYSFPILLMLISSIGIIWNVAPAFLPKIAKIPRLNIFAAILLIVNIVMNISGIVGHNTAVTNKRDAAVIRAATDAGEAVAVAAFYRARAEEAAAGLDDIEDAKLLHTADVLDEAVSYIWTLDPIRLLSSFDIFDMTLVTQDAGEWLIDDIVTLSSHVPVALRDAAFEKSGFASGAGSGAFSGRGGSL